MRFKLNLVLFLLVTLVLLVSSAISYYALRAELNERFEERKQSLAKRLQVNLDNVLWHYDKDQAANVIDAELDSPDVLAIRVFQIGDKQDALWVSRSKPVVEKPSGVLSLETPVDEAMRVPLYMRDVEERLREGAKEGAFAQRLPGNENLAGYAELVFSRQSVDHLLMEQVRNRLFEIGFLNAVLWLALFVVMRHLVIAPLAQLSSAFKDLAQNPKAGMIEIKCEDEFGEVVGAFNQIEQRLVSDIDRRVAAEASLRESNDELLHTVDALKHAQESLVQAEKFASLGSLVAGVAHEINTPVGVTVTGASFVLEQTQKIEKALNAGAVRKSEMLHFINSVSEGARLVLSNAERAAHLIQSFKQVAADETSEARRRFELRGYLDEVLTSLRPKYKKTRIKVSMICPADVEMDTYPGLLAQVLTNLVVNALTHGFEEGDEGSIEIRVMPEEEWVGIECYNDGQSIPPEHLGKIFDPFFTTRRSDGGTGLGLNIVFNIVTQRLGGTISVHSTDAEGTVFAVRIPKIMAKKMGGGERNDSV